MLESTGERLIPSDMQYPSAHYEHLQRYYFAAQIASGKKVLDLGSGEGYGSNILSQSAAEVVGVDISDEAVRWAADKYQRSNLKFLCGSAISVPLTGENLFDVIVCFEMIEHISEHEMLLAEMKRLLKPEGIVIVSTPNKNIYTDEPNFQNPFHVRELYFPEFKSLLEATFPFAEYLGQRFHSSLPMWPISKSVTGVDELILEKSADGFVRVNSAKKQPMYIVAVVSRQSLSPEVANLVSRYFIVIDTSDAFTKRLQEAYSTQLALSEANTKRHLADAQAANTRAEAANTRAATAEARIKEIESYLVEADRHLKFQETKIASLKLDLESIYGSHSWKALSSLRKLLLPLKWRLFRDAAFIEASGLFSAKWYLDQYPDIRAAGLRPSFHYLTNGWRDFRNPHRLFDTKWYLERYRDVIPERTNPLLYFLRVGIFEHHIPHPDFEKWDFSQLYREPLREYFQKKIARMGSARNYDEKTPEVSIVILNLNNAHLTFQCLTSLWYHTSGCKYEIIVIDNGSTPKDLEVLKSVDGPFRLIEVGCNRFFSEGNNIGAEAARGQYIAFLNNDTVATANWVEPLLNAFKTHPDCGAAGPKLIYPDGILQEAGSVIRSDGTSEQLGRGGRADDPQFNREATVDYVSAAAVLVRSDTFERVGGFDFCWEPAYYEDVDLCFKMVALGLRTYYVPSSAVIHFGSATTVDPSHGLQLDNIVEINRQKFLARWHQYIATRNTETATRLIPVSNGIRKSVRKISETNKRIALFTPFNIIPGGGERVLLTIAESLLQDYDVSLVTPNVYSSSRIRAVADILGVNVRDLRHLSIGDFYKAQPVDVWIAMGNQIIPPVSGRGKHNVYVLQFPFAMPEAEIQRSRAIWNTYGRVAVYSHYVESHVYSMMRRHELESRPIDVIYPPVVISRRKQVLPRTPYSIINVGRFFAGGHCKKQHLLIQAFGQIVQEHPVGDLELHLAGSLHPEREHRAYYCECRDLAQGLPVYFHLDASQSELTSLYESSSIYWHATGLDEEIESQPEKAEHFGISVVEAMAHGCIPVVYGVGGPTEIVEDGASGFLFHNSDELIEITTRLFAQHADKWVSDMRVCAESRANIFSTEKFANSWHKLVENELLQDVVDRAHAS